MIDAPDLSERQNHIHSSLGMIADRLAHSGEVKVVVMRETQAIRGAKSKTAGTIHRPSARSGIPGIFLTCLVLLEEKNRLRSRLLERSISRLSATRESEVCIGRCRQNSPLPPPQRNLGRINLNYDSNSGSTAGPLTSHPDQITMPPVPEWLEINSAFRIPLSELEFAFARSSGPGGQNVNKVSSKAQLRWRPGESASIPEELRFRVLTKLEPKLTVDGDLLVISQKYRDQPRNKEDCLEKLRAIVIASLVVPKVRKKLKPSRAAKARRLKDKKIGSARKEQRRSPSAEDP